MTATLPTVRMFWFGSPLSRLERLALTSFAAHGHPVELHTYEDVGPLPAGVRRCDAGETLPRELLFRHRRTGSVALFADWFRYRLLYERGGLWADADVVCLRPLDYPDSLVLGWETDNVLLNNAVLGTPQGHALARWMAENCERPNRPLPYDEWRIRLRKWKRRWLQGDRRDRVRWGENGPKGLTLAARHFGLLERALPSWHFYPVPAERWRELFTAPAAPAAKLDFGEARAVHLWNNKTGEWPGFDKNAHFPPDSPFERLWARYLSA